MAIFSALSFNDLTTAERDAGRKARGCKIIVACEARDGSWVDLDGQNVDQAINMARNWVEIQDARGASVWRVGHDGKLVGRSLALFTEGYEFPEGDGEPTRYAERLR